jgi:S1-C subfamily serine protease
VGSSGLAEFALSDSQLDELQVIVPEDFTTLRQRTFDLGTCYERPPAPVSISSGIPAVNDDAIQQDLFRSLQKAKSKETVFAVLNWQQALRQSNTQFSRPQARSNPLTAAQVYETCRSSVVVIGLLQPDGLVTQGTGFVVGPNVVATNFHVMDKPHSVAAGVLTSDHRFFEVREFLAGSPADDLALIRIDATDLPVLPLAETDTGIGAEVMALTHPDSHYFSMTFGRTTRYFQATRHALPSLRMGVTSDFSEGSSGGPVLDMFGNVVGIVSATRSNSTQMIHREAIPVSSLHKLLGQPDKALNEPTFPSITLSQPTK